MERWSHSTTWSTQSICALIWPAYDARCQFSWSTFKFIRGTTLKQHEDQGGIWWIITCLERSQHFYWTMEAMAGGCKSFSLFGIDSLGWHTNWIQDQQTCIYELRKLQQVRERVESEYLQLMQPRKELSAYMGPPLPINGSKSATKPKTQPFSKWGYLFSRISRHTWTRRWCFIYNEHFGWCTVSNKPSRAMVTVEEKISLASCDVKLITDTDRRYCFEVLVRPSQ